MHKIKETIIENECVKLTILNYGGIIKSIIQKRKNGQFNELVLGYSNNDKYFNDQYFLGAFIGRTAGRISGKKFKLNSEEFSLAPNEGNNFLHGGFKGLHKKFFNVNKISNTLVILKTKIIESDDQIPGDVDIEIKVELFHNQICIEYLANSSKDTIVNFTNHTYWNLSNDKKSDILNSQIILDKTSFLELDSNFIPTGKTSKINYTGSFAQLMKSNPNFVSGIDHFFETPSKKIVIENECTRIIYQTSEPGFVIYTGNFISNLNLDGEILNKFSGFCVEDQNYQDAINNNFGNWVLRSNDKYCKKTSWTIVEK